jgi:NAD(P)-dependent dehydrogenase (short-subunit alcohol dehydrogenase family)
MRELKGKVAVVTGAASGIGRALAERFAREGMKVVLADVEAQPLDAAREAVASLGADAVAVPTDVANRWQVDALARRAFEAFGTVHVLCNNAGVVFGGPAWDLLPEDWDWVFGVNFFGVVHGMRAFVPRMIEQGEGHVVNTASLAGLITVPFSAPYCATKHAVVAMSECLHHDLVASGATNVKVSVVCPSWVKTNIVASARNRPRAAAPSKAKPLSEAQTSFVGLLQSAVAGGIEPAEVAEQVLSAIVEERFWVLTHPRTKKAVELRARGIVEGRLNDFDWSKV